MMRWWWLCLVVSLLSRDQRGWFGSPRSDLDVATSVATAPLIPLERFDLLRRNVLAASALQLPTYPGNLPWILLHEIGSEGMCPPEILCEYRPLVFFQTCLGHYDATVKGYSLIFRKFEPRKTNVQEKLICHFREQPFSVYMRWLEGGNLLRSKILYVKTENDGNMLAPAPFIGYKAVNPHSALATSSSRYTIDQFGLKDAQRRTLASMHKAAAAGQLHLKYEGVYQVPELGKRECYKFVRKPYVPLEEEGVNELTIYIDREMLLQTGSIIRDAKGDLIAEYYFTDIKLNPTFESDQFTKAGLLKADKK